MRVRSVLFLCSIMIFSGVADNGYCDGSVTAKENVDKLIKTNSCRGCYLSGVNLNRVDLSDADLEGADLSQTKMYLTNLSRANLRNADLRGVVFGGADLADADLRGADLRGTDLDGAYLGGTLLDGMFVITKPYESSGVSEIEKEVYIDDPSKPKQQPKSNEIELAPRRDFEEPPPAMPVNAVKESVVRKENYPQAPEVKKPTPFKKVIIEGEDTKTVEEKVEEKVDEKIEKTAEEVFGDVIEEKSGFQKIADVKYSDEFLIKSGKGELSRKLALNKKKKDDLARLFDTNSCYGCNLSGTDLSNRNFDGADLEKSDLTGCNLENTDLQEANLKGALLIQTNLRGANLKKADFYRADLTGANLAGANVENTLFDGAELSGTVGLVTPGMILEKK